MATYANEYIEHQQERRKEVWFKELPPVAGLAEGVEVMRGRSATVDENYECATEVYRVIRE